MLFNNDIMEEMNLLLQFDSATMGNGIKVHSNAREGLVIACQNLFAKGLVSQSDGGYLTDAGIEALAHVQTLASLMETRKAP